MAAENAYRYDYGYAPKTEPEVKEEEKKAPQHLTRAKRAHNKNYESVELEVRDLKTFFKFAICGAIIVGVFGFAVYNHLYMETAKRNYEEAKENLVLCYSELKELDNELAALRTGKNIDQYAVDVLGYVKLAPENEFYFEAESNEVVLSQGQEKAE